MKRRACSRVGSGPQAPSVGLDDGPADRQSHAGALRLGSEECVENLLDLFWWNSNSGIHDRNQELTAVILLRLDRKFTWRVHALHGLDTIEHEIHQDLL